MMAIAIVAPILLLLILGDNIWQRSKQEDLEDKNKRLLEENEKLSNFVLEYQKENLLTLEEHRETSEAIAEIDTRNRKMIIEKNSEEFCRTPQVLVITQKSKVDTLIDKIENEMEVTNCYSQKHSDEEFNKRFEGENPLVIIELNNGIVKLKDCAAGRPWTVDLIYNGVLFTNLSTEQNARLKALFIEKMAEAALRDVEKAKYGPDYPGVKQISPGIYIQDD